MSKITTEEIHDTCLKIFNSSTDTNNRHMLQTLIDENKLIDTIVKHEIKHETKTPPIVTKNDELRQELLNNFQDMATRLLYDNT